jgi:hypothetical protein
MTEFIESLPVRSEKAHDRLIQEVGSHAGVPGATLRHTFLRLLVDKTHYVDDVMRFGGCSPKVAVSYVRTTESERDGPILEGGILPG